MVVDMKIRIASYSTVFESSENAKNSVLWPKICNELDFHNDIIEYLPIQRIFFFIYSNNETFSISVESMRLME